MFGSPFGVVHVKEALLRKDLKVKSEGKHLKARVAKKADRSKQKLVKRSL